MAWVKMSGLLTFRPAIMSDNEQYGPYKDPEGKSFSRAFPDQIPRGSRYVAFFASRAQAERVRRYMSQSDGQPGASAVTFQTCSGSHGFPIESPMF